MSKRAARSSTPAPPARRGWVLPAILGFVVGVAATWAFVHRASGGPSGPGVLPRTTADRTALDSAPTATQREEIETLLKTYFGSWSRRDIDAYGRCFHPNARVWFGTGSSLGLAEFLESQRQAHANSPVPLTEDPLAWDIQVNNGLAHVRVHWELHRATENIRGYDFFTLAFTKGRWQIVALVFNEE